MYIAFICPVFPPEPAPAGVMAKELASALARDGHEVRVFTQFPNRPEGRVYPGYMRRLRTVESVDGFDVIRCPNWILDSKRRSIHRILENFTFGLSSCFNLARGKRPDVVLLESWPLFATQAVLTLCALWRVPVINYVQDCYPEALEHTGHFQVGGRLATLLRRWDRRICLRSRKVIAISPGMKTLLCRSREIPESKVSVVQNWIDGRCFRTFPKENPWRQQAGVLPQQFLILYAGTLGHVSGAEVLVRTARLLEHRKDVTLVCAGEGILKAKMQADAAGLSNLLFLPFQPAERVAEMHAAADATILTTQQNYPDASVPSKLITYLAAGRPVLCATQDESTVATIVRDAGAGLVIPAGDPERLAAAILYVIDHPNEAQKMGENARRCFEEQFTFEQAYKKIAAILDRACEDAGPLGARRPLQTDATR